MDEFFEACPWSRCISLTESKGRRVRTRREFRKRGIACPTFLNVERDDENPGRGCYMSHYTCMKKALGANQPHALVFEDDVRVRHIRPEVWKEATTFISTQPFDILLLGWCVGDGYRKNMCTRTNQVLGYDHIYETKCLCTHAVVYSRKFMEYFVKNHADYPGYEIDDVFTDLDVNMHILRPALFDQREDASTIDDADVERVFLRPKV